MSFDKARKLVPRLQLAKRRTKLLYGFITLSVRLLVVITSHGGVSESRGSPNRWMSSRTRCTCCRPGRAGESDPGHTRIRARSSPNRTIRSASRRPGARESGLSRTRIHARSSSNRNVCILSPCQFSFRRVVYQTNSPRTIPPPIPVPIWILATLELATLPHWQHFPPPFYRSHPVNVTRIRFFVFW